MAANLSLVCFSIHLSSVFPITEYGFYMYIEASNELENSRAHLISKPILCEQNQCLTFWYHMFGDDIGSLSVYQKYKTDMTRRWRKKNAQNTQWNQARVDLNCDQEFQIVIEGKTKIDWVNWYGEIAIDDIYVFEAKCDGKSVLFQVQTFELNNLLSHNLSFECCLHLRHWSSGR